MSSPIRIITFNIRGGLGMDDLRSTERIAETVVPYKPDIICFQEVHQRLPWSGLIDQPRRLRRLLQMHFVLQRNIRLGLGGYGVGIATRFPIVSWHRHRLPSGQEPRGALEVRLETPDGPLTVFCTHWGLSPEERVQQASRLAELISAAPCPVIVAGDLNDRPFDQSVRILRTKTGLHDADAERDRLTYPADEPTVRIDYLLHSDDLRAEEVTVIPALSSDHLPLLAVFGISSKPG